MDLDVVYMFLCKGYQFLVVVHCDPSSWVEAKSLRTLFSQVIIDFLWKDIVCCHNCFKKLMIDGGFENKDAVVKLI